MLSGSEEYESDRTLAGSSRYCAGSFRYPSPYEEPEGFVAAVAEASARRSADVVFPMTDISTGHILRARDRLGPTRVAAGSLEAYETLSDKWRLSELAAELGVPAPETRLAQGADEAARAAKELGFPVVVKPRATVARRSG